MNSFVLFVSNAAASGLLAMITLVCAAGSIGKLDELIKNRSGGWTKKDTALAVWFFFTIFFGISTLLPLLTCIRIAWHYTIFFGRTFL